MKTATSANVNVHGSIVLQITIENKVFNHNFIIADITDECILGLDFLHDFEAVIDVRGKVLKFPEFDAFLFKEDESCSKHHVNTLKEVTLKALTEQIIQVKVGNNNKKSDVCLLEPDYLRLPKGIVVAKTLISTDEESIWVKVMNIENKDIVLKKDPG